MIWLKFKKLEDKIANDQLTEQDSRNYLIATLAYGFIAHMFSLSKMGFNHLAYIPPAISIVLCFIGIPILYKINQKYDNKDFVKRFLAVAWVTRMNLLIITAALSIIALQVFDFKSNNDDPAKTISIMSFSIVLNILFYVLSILSFKRLSKHHS
jgi:uncharacterized membrane protein